MLENEKILHSLRGLKPSILQPVIMADPKRCRELLQQAKRTEAAAAITEPQAAMLTTTTTSAESIEEIALRRTTI
ncbi:unnamed protein product [Didymodactylos carnosus]|uniref:Uncharacterized protein n=1 Tax=Didymodactylos carnosus TaxID=1234261 RepID=A0A816EXE8_9BILA|nr:unnamed protein product [Didymodactylos carnosus]CAF4580984.1 unnamed protein product [Didymodactylos carnosus]